MTLKFVGGAIGDYVYFYSIMNNTKTARNT